jgi:hypothetical protein
MSRLTFGDLVASERFTNLVNKATAGKASPEDLVELGAVKARLDQRVPDPNAASWREQDFRSALEASRRARQK